VKGRNWGPLIFAAGLWALGGRPHDHGPSLVAAWCRAPVWHGRAWRRKIA